MGESKKLLGCKNIGLKFLGLRRTKRWIKKYKKHRGNTTGIQLISLKGVFSFPAYDTTEKNLHSFLKDVY